MHHLLKTTMSTTFVPGMNLKGAAAGANWLFLLPSLELQRVLCIGTPGAATMDALVERCEQLFVLAEKDDAHTISGAYRPNLTTCRELPPLPDGSMDLIVIASGRGRPSFHKDYCLQHEALRLLKRDGLLYHEAYLVRRRRLDNREPVQPASVLEQFTALWMSPVGGEVQCVVPAGDDRTLAYFAGLGLNSSGQSLTQYWSQPIRGGAQEPSNAPRIVRKVFGKLDRKAGKLLARAEHLASRLRLHQMLVMRQGVLAGRAAGALAHQPPAYLSQIAAAAGIDLAGFRWGFSAPGDYGSRKALFYLFPRAAGPAGASPQYVVKMVRSTAFSPRLNNETDALRRLAALEGFCADGIIPHVAFAGEHAGLAIVGTSAINGSSFRAAIQNDADGAYLARTINWFTELAVATGTTNRASGTAVAQTLELLLDRFLELYRVDGRHRTFLAGQLDRIARTAPSIPIVFQHGDPGVWNLMVTPAGAVAILDWEAAEVNGLPLWDLFYFLRSYAVSAMRTRGTRTSLDAFAAALLRDTPLSRTLRSAVANYCERTMLPEELVQPLFFTCWMHRALKEATRLAPARLDDGHYVNLLRMCIDTNSTGAAAWPAIPPARTAAVAAQVQ